MKVRVMIVDGVIDTVLLKSDNDENLNMEIVDYNKDEHDLEWLHQFYEEDGFEDVPFEVIS